MSFTIKSFSLISGIIAFFLLIYIVSYFSGGAEEKKEAMNFEMQARYALTKLVSREDCLAYSFGGVAQKGVLDIEKLERFSRDFYDNEPLCAMEENFDYKISVREEPMELEIYSKFSGDIEYLLSEINRKNTVFLMDVSASMLEPCGTFEGRETSKIECVEIFMKSFIDNLADESKIALFVYPGNYWVFPMTQVGGNRESLKAKSEFVTEKGTPMCIAMQEAYNYAGQEKIDRIVLLTDGCENSRECPIGASVNVVRSNIGISPPVHSIAFGEDVDRCTHLLEEISNITEGDYYRALTCEELAGRTPQYRISTQEILWDFGVRAYSPQKAQYNRITITLPATIRYDEKTYRRATLIMEAVSGELETIAGKIEKICHDEKKTKLSLEMQVTYPITYSNGKICISSSEPICKAISCPHPVVFEDIKNTGRRLITMDYINGNIEVRT
jgi:hypothetical protein